MTAKIIQSLLFLSICINSYGMDHKQKAKVSTMLQENNEKLMNWDAATPSKPARPKVQPLPNLQLRPLIIKTKHMTAACKKGDFNQVLPLFNKVAPQQVTRPNYARLTAEETQNIIEEAITTCPPTSTPQHIYQKTLPQMTYTSGILTPEIEKAHAIIKNAMKDLARNDITAQVNIIDYLLNKCTPLYNTPEFLLKTEPEETNNALELLELLYPLTQEKKLITLDCTKDKINSLKAQVSPAVSYILHTCEYLQTFPKTTESYKSFLLNQPDCSQTPEIKAICQFLINYGNGALSTENAACNFIQAMRFEPNLLPKIAQMPICPHVLTKLYKADFKDNHSLSVDLHYVLAELYYNNKDYKNADKHYTQLYNHLAQHESHKYKKIESSKLLESKQIEPSKLYSNAFIAYLKSTKNFDDTKKIKFFSNVNRILNVLQNYQNDPQLSYNIGLFIHALSKIIEPLRGTVLSSTLEHLAYAQKYGTWNKEELITLANMRAELYTMLSNYNIYIACQYNNVTHHHQALTNIQQAIEYHAAYNNDPQDTEILTLLAHTANNNPNLYIQSTPWITVILHLIYNKRKLTNPIFQTYPSLEFASSNLCVQLLPYLEDAYITNKENQHEIAYLLALLHRRHGNYLQAYDYKCLLPQDSPYKKQLNQGIFSLDDEKDAQIILHALALLEKYKEDLNNPIVKPLCLFALNELPVTDLILTIVSHNNISHPISEIAQTLFCSKFMALLEQASAKAQAALNTSKSSLQAKDLHAMISWLTIINCILAELYYHSNQKIQANQLYKATLTNIPLHEPYQDIRSHALDAYLTNKISFFKNNSKNKEELNYFVSCCGNVNNQLAKIEKIDSEKSYKIGILIQSLLRNTPTMPKEEQISLLMSGIDHLSYAQEHGGWKKGHQQDMILINQDLHSSLATLYDNAGDTIASLKHIKKTLECLVQYNGDKQANDIVATLTQAEENNSELYNKLVPYIKNILHFIYEQPLQMENPIDHALLPHIISSNLCSLLPYCKQAYTTNKNTSRDIKYIMALYHRNNNDSPIILHALEQLEKEKTNSDNPIIAPMCRFVLNEIPVESFITIITSQENISHAVSQIAQTLFCSTIITALENAILPDNSLLLSELDCILAELYYHAHQIGDAKANQIGKANDIYKTITIPMRDAYAQVRSNAFNAYIIRTPKFGPKSIAYLASLGNINDHLTAFKTTNPMMSHRIGKLTHELLKNNTIKNVAEKISLLENSLKHLTYAQNDTSYNQKQSVALLQLKQDAHSSLGALYESQNDHCAALEQTKHALAHNNAQHGKNKQDSEIVAILTQAENNNPELYNQLAPYTTNILHFIYNQPLHINKQIDYALLPKIISSDLCALLPYCKQPYTTNKNVSHDIKYIMTLYHSGTNDAQIILDVLNLLDNTDNPVMRSACLLILDECSTESFVSVVLSAQDISSTIAHIAQTPFCSKLISLLSNAALRNGNQQQQDTICVLAELYYHSGDIKKAHELYSILSHKTLVGDPYKKIRSNAFDACLETVGNFGEKEIQYLRSLSEKIDDQLKAIETTNAKKSYHVVRVIDALLRTQAKMDDHKKIDLVLNGLMHLAYTQQHGDWTDKIKDVMMLINGEFNLLLSDLYVNQKNYSAALKHYKHTLEYRVSRNGDINGSSILSLLTQAEQNNPKLYAKYAQLIQNLLFFMDNDIDKIEAEKDRSLLSQFADYDLCQGLLPYCENSYATNNQPCNDIFYLMALCSKNNSDIDSAGYYIDKIENPTNETLSLKSEIYAVAQKALPHTEFATILQSFINKKQPSKHEEWVLLSLIAANNYFIEPEDYTLALKLIEKITDDNDIYPAVIALVCRMEESLIDTKSPHLQDWLAGLITINFYAKIKDASCYDDENNYAISFLLTQQKPVASYEKIITHAQAALNNTNLPEDIIEAAQKICAKAYHNWAATVKDNADEYLRLLDKSLEYHNAVMVHCERALFIFDNSNDPDLVRQALNILKDNINTHNEAKALSLIPMGKALCHYHDDPERIPLLQKLVPLDINTGLACLKDQIINKEFLLYLIDVFAGKSNLIEPDNYISPTKELDCLNLLINADNQTINKIPLLLRKADLLLAENPTEIAFDQALECLKAIQAINNNRVITFNAPCYNDRTQHFITTKDMSEKAVEWCCFAAESVMQINSRTSSAVPPATEDQIKLADYLLAAAHAGNLNAQLTLLPYCNAIDHYHSGIEHYKIFNYTHAALINPAAALQPSKVNLLIKYLSEYTKDGVALAYYILCSHYTNNPQILEKAMVLFSNAKNQLYYLDDTTDTVSKITLSCKKTFEPYINRCEHKKNPSLVDILGTLTLAALCAPSDDVKELEYATKLLLFVSPFCNDKLNLSHYKTTITTLLRHVYYKRAVMDLTKIDWTLLRKAVEHGYVPAAHIFAEIFMQQHKDGKNNTLITKILESDFIPLLQKDTNSETCERSRELLKLYNALKKNKPTKKKLTHITPSSDIKNNVDEKEKSLVDQIQLLLNYKVDLLDADALTDVIDHDIYDQILECLRQIRANNGGTINFDTLPALYLYIDDLIKSNEITEKAVEWCCFAAESAITVANSMPSSSTPQATQRQKDIADYLLYAARMNNLDAQLILIPYFTAINYHLSGVHYYEALNCSYTALMNPETATKQIRLTVLLETLRLYMQEGHGLPYFILCNYYQNDRQKLEEILMLYSKATDQTHELNEETIDIVNKITYKIALSCEPTFMPYINRCLEQHEKKKNPSLIDNLATFTFGGIRVHSDDPNVLKKATVWLATAARSLCGKILNLQQFLTPLEILLGYVYHKRSRLDSKNIDLDLLRKAVGFGWLRAAEDFAELYIAQENAHEKKTKLVTEKDFLPLMNKYMEQNLSDRRTLELLGQYIALKENKVTKQQPVSVQEKPAPNTNTNSNTNTPPHDTIASEKNFSLLKLALDEKRLLILDEQACKQKLIKNENYDEKNKLYLAAIGSFCEGLYTQTDDLLKQIVKKQEHANAQMLFALRDLMQALTTKQYESAKKSLTKALNYGLVIKSMRDKTKQFHNILFLNILFCYMESLLMERDHPFEVQYELLAIIKTTLKEAGIDLIPFENLFKTIADITLSTTPQWDIQVTVFNENSLSSNTSNNSKAIKQSQLCLDGLDAYKQGHNGKGLDLLETAVHNTQDPFAAIILASKYCRGDGVPGINFKVSDHFLSLALAHGIKEKQFCDQEFVALLYLFIDMVITTKEIPPQNKKEFLTTIKKHLELKDINLTKFEDEVKERTKITLSLHPGWAQEKRPKEGNSLSNSFANTLLYHFDMTTGNIIHVKSNPTETPLPPTTIEKTINQAAIVEKAMKKAIPLDQRALILKQKANDKKMLKHEYFKESSPAYAQLLLLYGQGEWAKADPQLEQFVKKNPNHPCAGMKLAIRRLAQSLITKNYDAIIKILPQALNAGLVTTTHKKTKTISGQFHNLNFLDVLFHFIQAVVTLAEESCPKDKCLADIQLSLLEPVKTTLEKNGINLTDLKKLFTAITGMHLSDNFMLIDPEQPAQPTPQQPSKTTILANLKKGLIKSPETRLSDDCIKALMQFKKETTQESALLFIPVAKQHDPFACITVATNCVIGDVIPRNLPSTEIFLADALKYGLIENKFCNDTFFAGLCSFIGAVIDMPDLSSEIKEELLSPIKKELIAHGINPNLFEAVVHGETNKKLSECPEWVGNNSTTVVSILKILPTDKPDDATTKSTKEEKRSEEKKQERITSTNKAVPQDQRALVLKQKAIEKKMIKHEQYKESVPAYITSVHLYTQGKTTEADEQLEQLVKKNPLHPCAGMKLALRRLAQALTSKNYDSAIQILPQALSAGLVTTTHKKTKTISGQFHNTHFLDILLWYLESLITENCPTAIQLNFLEIITTTLEKNGFNLTDVRELFTTITGIHVSDTFMLVDSEKSTQPMPQKPSKEMVLANLKKSLIQSSASSVSDDFMEAISAYNKKTPKKSVTLIIHAAKKHDPSACINASTNYLIGDVIPQNIPSAKEFLTAALTYGLVENKFCNEYFLKGLCTFIAAAMNVKNLSSQTREQLLSTIKKELITHNINLPLFCTVVQSEINQNLSAYPGWIGTEEKKTESKQPTTKKLTEQSHTVDIKKGMIKNPENKSSLMVGKAQDAAGQGHIAKSNALFAHAAKHEQDPCACMIMAANHLIGSIVQKSISSSKDFLTYGLEYGLIKNQFCNKNFLLELGTYIRWIFITVQSDEDRELLLAIIKNKLIEHEIDLDCFCAIVENQINIKLAECPEWIGTKKDKMDPLFLAALEAHPEFSDQIKSLKNTFEQLEKSKNHYLTEKKQEQTNTNDSVKNIIKSPEDPSSPTLLAAIQACKKRNIPKVLELGNTLLKEGKNSSAATFLLILSAFALEHDSEKNYDLAKQYLCTALDNGVVEGKFCNNVFFDVLQDYFTDIKNINSQKRNNIGNIVQKKLKNNNISLIDFKIQCDINNSIIKYPEDEPSPEFLAMEQAIVKENDHFKATPIAHTGLVKKDPLIYIYSATEMLTEKSYELSEQYLCCALAYGLKEQKFCNGTFLSLVFEYMHKVIQTIPSKQKKQKFLTIIRKELEKNNIDPDIFCGLFEIYAKAPFSFNAQ